MDAPCKDTDLCSSARNSQKARLYNTSWVASLSGDLPSVCIFPKGSVLRQSLCVGINRLKNLLLLEASKDYQVPYNDK